MADTVTNTIVRNGPMNLVLSWTNLSDGTGETGVKKYDATSATYAVNGVAPGIHTSIWRLQYDIKGGGVVLQWDASSAQDALVLSGEGDSDKWFRMYGGLTVPVITGATGSLLLTTTGFMPNSGYTIIIHLRKNIAV